MNESLPKFHLAQANIGLMRGLIDDPIMKGFVDRLPRINAIADASLGFIWRLKSDDAGDATAIRVSDNPRVIINMSVWQSVEALAQFTYKSEHAQFLQRRGEWFERMGVPTVVLWWISVGHEPTVEEARQRLEMLAERGPTAEAFTFRHAFTPPIMGL